jgi:hypothetical protein
VLDAASLAGAGERSVAAGSSLLEALLEEREEDR